MATYANNKSNAFKTIDEAKIPYRKRSESRLKRYSSATDTRVWAHYAFENKAFIIDMMGQDPQKKHKVLGQIIPIDVIWKIITARKNEYIYDLQDQIQSFINLLRGINLTTSQILKIKSIMGSTHFFNIRDLLIDSKTTERRNLDMEKSVQVKPQTLSTISETKVITNSVAIKTTPPDQRDNYSITQDASRTDQSNSTITRPVSHASIQVVLAPRQMCDKATIAKLHSAYYLAKKMSKIEQTELEMSKVQIPASGIRKTSDRSVVSKSQADLKPVLSSDPIRTRKSCVTFKDSTDESKPKKVKSKPSGSVVVAAEKIGVNVDAIIESIVTDRDDITKTGSEDLIEVISECEQTSLASCKDCRSSVIQLYRSSKKSSIESYIKRRSESFDDDRRREIVNYPQVVSTVEMATSTSRNYAPPPPPPDDSVNSPSVDYSYNVNVVGESSQLLTRYPSGSSDDSDEKVVTKDASDDDEEQFVDCDCLIAVITASSDGDMVEQVDEGTDVRSYPKDVDCSCLLAGMDASVDDMVEQVDQETDNMSYQIVEDCSCLTAGIEAKKTDQRDQGTIVISCIKGTKKKARATKDDECWQQLKRKEEELQNTRLYAKRAIWQLELIRQTLLDNSNITLNLNVTKMSENLKDSHACNEDILEFEKELKEICGQSESDACRILNAQLQVLKTYCNQILTDGEENARLREDNLRLQSPKAPDLNPSHSQLVDIPANGEGSEKKRQKQQIEYWKSKLIKYDQITLERNKLRESVLKLENELKLYDDIKAEFVPTDFDEGSDLPLLEIEDIQTQIAQLKRKAYQCDKLQNELDEERNRGIAMKENFAKFSTSKFNESETMRYRAQEADILRLERDRLQLKVTELLKFQADNINLQNKCAELERSHFPTEYHHEGSTAPEFGDDYQSAQDQADAIRLLLREKEALLRTVVTKECELADQEDQIERLVTHVDRLTTNNELQQEKSKKLISQLRLQLDAKENHIAKMDNEIEWVEEKLKESIDSISKDSHEWQTKVAKMECYCKRYKSRLDAMQDAKNSLQKQLEMQDELNKNYSLELQKKNKILEDILNKSGTGETLDQKMQNVNRMENILKKSHNAVRKVVEELAKQYRCDLKGIRDVVPDMINN